MDIKKRLKNKTTVTALLAAAVAFIYEICGILGIVPMIGQDQVVQAVAMLITFLVSIGVLVDPTTAGITDKLSDSEQSLMDGMPSGYTDNVEENSTNSIEGDNCGKDDC